MLLPPILVGILACGPALTQAPEGRVNASVHLTPVTHKMGKSWHFPPKVMQQLFRCTRAFSREEDRTMSFSSCIIYSACLASFRHTQPHPPVQHQKICLESACGSQTGPFPQQNGA
jgi:hypothetical protein